jgi:hypothetical protein
MFSALLPVWLALAPAPADPAPDPVALVSRLGSDDFAEREAAAKDLKALGAKAEPALKAALASENPEARTRAAQLLVAIRRDALDALAKTFDPAGTAEPDHPIWKRYKGAAGSDGPARRLFAEIVRDPHRLRLLDRAESDPDKVGALYERHVKQLGENVQKGLDHRQKRGFRVAGNVIDLDDPTPEPADVAVGLYLGTFPATAKALENPRWEQHPAAYASEEGSSLLGNAFQQGLDRPYRSTPAERATAPAFARLFAAWLAARRNPGSIATGLAHARFAQVAEALPTARAVLADVKQPLKLRAEALPLLGAFGAAKDEALVAALLEDTTAVGECNYGPAQKGAKVQVRDVALAALLVLRGKDPAAFGFPGLEFHRAGPLKTVPLYPHYLGFYDDASRAAAHAGAREWLDARK